MGKNDGFMTAKAIGNRIKAKGLTKLRWYCQMCEKACRDENGFKCHCESESHLRQMTIAAQNGGKIVNQFSVDFEKGFMDILSRRFGEKRVKATQVYNEYIHDRHHIHMNSTEWISLTAFIMYLGKEGKARVDQDEEGRWWLAWINRDPAHLARIAAQEQKAKKDLDDRERQEKMLNKQLEAMKEMGGAASAAPAAPTELKRQEGEKVSLSLGLGKKPAAMATAATGATSLGSGAGGLAGAGAGAGGVFRGNAFDTLSSSGSNKRSTSDYSAGGSGHATSSGADSGKRPKLSAMEEIMQEERKRKEREAGKALAADNVGDKRLENWLFEGIVVKVMNKKLLDGSLYKKKGVVIAIHDTFVGEVRLLDNDAVLRIDQSELETVLPSVDGRVMIVNGRNRGCYGRLKAVNADKYNASVVIETGPRSGDTMPAVEYDDVCKVDSSFKPK